MYKRKSKAEKFLRKIQAQTKGEFRISRRRVPHLVIGNFSVCYFERGDFFRIFIDYAKPTNRKLRDFKYWFEVVKFFTEVADKEPLVDTDRHVSPGDPPTSPFTDKRRCEHDWKETVDHPGGEPYFRCEKCKTTKDYNEEQHA